MGTDVEIEKDCIQWLEFRMQHKTSLEDHSSVQIAILLTQPDMCQTKEKRVCVSCLKPET